MGDKEKKAWVERRNKAVYMATEVACGWAGAVIKKNRKKKQRREWR